MIMSKDLSDIYLEYVLSKQKLPSQDFHVCFEAWLAERAYILASLNEQWEQEPVEPGNRR